MMRDIEEILLDRLIESEVARKTKALEIEIDNLYGEKKDLIRMYEQRIQELEFTISTLEPLDNGEPKFKSIKK